MHKPSFVHTLAGAFGGVVAAGAALAVGYLVAVVTGGPWPVDAVGVQVIDWSPGPVKDWAVRTLGTADRPLLRVGICTTLVVIAAIAGALATRGHRRTAITITGALGLIGLTFATVSRSAATNTPNRLLPATITLLAAVAAMTLVTRALDPPTTTPRPTPPDTSDPLTHPTHSNDAHQPPGFDRRRFLVAVSALAVAGGGAAGAARVVGGSGDGLRARVRVPRVRDGAGALRAGLDVPGISPFMTENAKFYRVDTLLQVPRIDPRKWELRVHGLVGKELRLSFEELLQRRLIERDITLTCVSNEVGGPYVGNARWIGVPIADILREAGVQPGADAVKSTSVDGLTIGTPLGALTDGRDAIFAVAMNGEPLPFEHGFPVRMVVPGLYGYVSATKWIVDFEVTRFRDFSAYWTNRGWSVEAPIKTSARIDVPKGFANLKAGPTIVAGVAWAQHRGISKVEVRIDDGPWQPATLAPADTTDTWRQWTYRWNATPGTHKLTVRATDGNGELQTDHQAAPRPNGSSGLHNTVVMVT
ncbi:molybdopterin-dependent oxidoreductase [Kribbella sp. NPDC004536]|uniref:molybdopterin-dependent oxidoreductase n=1 Tax=Kribbella sp. NPDC004536 TaxID=3364106 RepID=UPI0036A036BC